MSTAQMLMLVRDELITFCLDPSLFVLKDPRPKNVGRGKM